MDEQRNTFRRSVNSLAMRNGEVEESKLWAQLGKGLCVWLIYKHADQLILHWEVLIVLLAFLIAPELVKKIITMKFGGGETTRATRDVHEESITTPKTKEFT